MKNPPAGYSWDSFPEDVKARIEEKKRYEKRLGDLLEDVRQAALGIDYQTRVQLRQIEKKVIDKLFDTRVEIENIIKSAKTQETNRMQGKLFND